MTPTKWLASLCVLGLLAIAGALFFFRSGPVKTESVQGMAIPAPAPRPAVAGEANAFRAGEPMKRVMDLYVSESQRVGQVDPDPKATEKRLEANARELTPGEVDWLRAQAMDIKNDADARFFAVFLLGLSHKESAVGALSQVALMPLPASKNTRLVEQERALRASAVEGISHAYAEFPGKVKDALLDVVSSQPDEFVQDRAHRGLYAGQYGKSIEEQDKAALEKLRKK